MKKYLITITIILATLWFSLTSLMNSAMANDYNKAVIGHVIKEKVTGGNIDTSQLMEQELQKLAHQYVLQTITIMQHYLPSILDGIAADLRLKADKQYKCALLEGSKIEDDCR